VFASKEVVDKVTLVEKTALIWKSSCAITYRTLRQELRGALFAIS
jgi:hypothetical protein